MPVLRRALEKRRNTLQWGHAATQPREFEGGPKPMVTAPSYVEQHAIPQDKGLMEHLMDFSFQRMVTPRMLKMLYSVHLLLGLIVATGFVFNGFESSTSNGLLAMILGAVGMFFWILYCRIMVEVLAVVFRVGEVISGSQQNQ